MYTDPMERTRHIHQIEPVFDGCSRILLLGTFPSPKSREAGFFYGHPQNRMWRVLAAVCGEDVPQTVEERRAFLLRNRVAMWDVLASCAIRGASDASIRDAVPNDLSRILDAAPIERIYATGAKPTSCTDAIWNPYTDANVRAFPRRARPMRRWGSTSSSKLTGC